MKIKNHAATVAVVFLATMAIACGAGDNKNEGKSDSNDTTTTSQEGSDIDGEVGDTINVGDKMKVTITEVDLDVKSDNSLDKAKNGAFVAAYVKIEALTDAMIIGPHDFSIMDAENVVYDSTYTLGIDKVLESDTLDTGQKAKGWVVFDVDPEGFATGTVQYDWGFEDPATWSFTA